MVRTRMAMCFSNNKQKQPYEYCASFVVIYCRITLFIINLELF